MAHTPESLAEIPPRKLFDMVKEALDKQADLLAHAKGISRSEASRRTHRQANILMETPADVAKFLNGELNLFPGLSPRDSGEGAHAGT